MPFYMLECLRPEEGEHAQYRHEPDDEDRSWTAGKRFFEPPAVPLVVTVEPGEEGSDPELTDVPLPLMSRRLADCLKAAGVTNIDWYPVEVEELESGKVSTGLLAFNLLGAVAAADLEASNCEPTDGPSGPAGFDEAGIFRRAGPCSAIVVSQRIRDAIEAAGITTLAFVPPEEWVG